MSEDATRSRGARRWKDGYEEVIVAVVLLAVFTFFRIFLDDFVRGREGSYVGPTFWPGVLLTLGIVFSAIYLVQAIVKARREEPVVRMAPAPQPVATDAVEARMPDSSDAPAELADDAPVVEASPEEDLHRRGHVGKTVLGAALLAAYIWLLAPIGFIPATVVFTIAFLLLVGERRWWMLIVFPVAASAFVILIFTQVLTIPLPRGTGIFLTLSTYLY